MAMNVAVCFHWASAAPTAAVWSSLLENWQPLAEELGIQIAPSKTRQRQPSKFKLRHRSGQDELATTPNTLAGFSRTNALFFTPLRNICAKRGHRNTAPPLALR